MTRSVEAIQADVERERRQLVGATERLRAQLGGKLDVRSRMRPRAVVAAAAGFLALLVVLAVLKALVGAAIRLVAGRVRDAVA